MPTIERVIGMHNQNDEANTDKVWAGVIVRGDGRDRQFVALNGRRLGFIRPTAQPPGPVLATQNKFEQMRREKLAHGYRVINWTEPRYGLLSAVARLGEIPESVILGAQQIGAPLEERVRPESLREQVTRVDLEQTERQRYVDDATQLLNGIVSGGGRPSVEELMGYIAGRTGTEVPSEPEPEPEPKPTEPPVQIRKARRLDF